MNFRKSILAAAALGLAGAVLPAMPAMAQEQQHWDNHDGNHQGDGRDDHRGDRRDNGQDWRGGDRHDNGQHGYHHDNGQRGYRHNGRPEWGAVLGYDGRYPHYCRNHRHWRWNARRHAYVYSYRGGYC
jgi:opacity protein-like surface antigen